MPILRPDDPGYDDARRGFNLFADARPWGIAEPTTVDEVRALVAQTATEGVTIAPVGTGHQIGALPDLSRTLLLRPRIEGGVQVDAAARTARVAAGTTWETVVSAAAEHDLFALHGSSPTVAVVGYLLSGGSSFYGRRYGVAANHVRAIELVDADGVARRVDADHDPDVFWALRGGGGAFGIVTAVEIDLFDATGVQGGTLYWPMTDAKTVMRAWLTWCADAPPEVSSSFRIVTLPPVPAVPEQLRATPHAAFDALVLADADTAAEMIAPLRSAADPVIDTFGELTPVTAARLHGDPESPLPYVSTAGSVSGLDDAAVDAFLGAAGEGSVLLAAELRQLGGALAVAPAGAGVTGALGDGFLLYGVGVPAGPVTEDAVIASCARLHDAMEPWRDGHQYLGFVEQHTDAAEAFDGDAYARLAAIRERVDPQRRFVVAHDIDPPKVDQ
jgi:FAD/FMN-containing dehydrogenase